MFTPNVLRRISAVVLCAFTSLTMQPLQAAVQGESSNAPATPDKSQRYGQALEKIRDGLQTAKSKQEQGQSTDDEVSQVRAQKAELDALEADVEADFNAVGQHLSDHNLPAEILARHEAALAEFDAKKAELKQKFDAFEAVANDPEQRKLKLKDLADYMQAQQHKQTHTPSDPNKLPFRTPDSNIRPPIETVAAYKSTLFKQKPVYLAANGSLSGITLPSTTLPATPTDADLAETEDVQLTDAIKAQALALGHNPVQIHNWVCNNIEFIPTYGSIQGADLTLQTKRGNAFDTASLEIALLRASGIPARYVYGTVQVSADQAMNWVGGVNVPEAAQNLMGQGGIPNIGLASGGLIKYIKLEHVWVEAWVDYIPSRGAINKNGDTWIPMDASFKQYRYTSGMNIKNNVALDADVLISQAQAGSTINQTEGWIQNFNDTNLQIGLTDYETQLKTYVDSQKTDATVGDVLGTKTIQPQITTILAGTLPYRVLAIGTKMTTLPDNLRHKFQYNLYANDYERVNDSPLFRHTVSLPDLAGKKITLSFIPATQADIDLINSYLPKPHADGSPIQPSELPSSLPGYLIKLKAELRVDGNIVETAGPFTMGQELISNMGLYEPGKGWQYGEDNRPTAGEYIATHVDGQGVSPNQLQSLKNKLATTRAKILAAQYEGLTKEDISGDILYSSVLSYFAAGQTADRLSGQASQIVDYRKPSFGSFFAAAQPSYWFGLPRNVSFPGLVMDIDWYMSMAAAKDNSSTKSYIEQTGMRLSTFEHLIPEKLFSDAQHPAEAASAVKALTIAANQGQKIYTINAQNLFAVLPALNINADVKDEIQNAVNSGKTVTVSQGKVSVGGWTGVGYIISDPGTGAGAYKISGGANGGYLYLVANAAGTVAQIAIMAFIVGLVTGTALIGIWFVAAAIIFASLISYLAFFYDERAVDDRYWLSETIILWAGALPHFATTYGPLVYLVELMMSMRQK